MKTIAILAYPDLLHSKVNAYWRDHIIHHPQVTVHDLCAEYPDHRINVAYEQ